MEKLVYADHAATTPLDGAALEAMLPYMTRQYANPSQPYTAAGETRRALNEARERIAACIGAHPEEIVFTSGGTEGNVALLRGAG